MNRDLINVLETEAGVYSVLVEGAAYEVRAVGDEITVNGHSFTIVIEDPRQWKRAEGPGGGTGRVQILAPMPGKVVRLLVAVGAEVQAGQGIVVMEAMKMQNELKSPREGRVTAIRVQENESVTAGAVLAVIE